MNKPYLTTATRSRRFCWMVRTFRGDYKRLSGFFLTEASAQRWIAKQRQEDPAFGLQ